MGLGQRFRRLGEILLEIGYSAFKPRFILFHAIYIVMWSIVGSILIYPERNIPYIDSLILAAGASTQSGLNTVDINNLTSWQQAVLYIIPTFTNPISIHAFLVFVRLYWFEKAVTDIAMRSRIQHRIRKAKTFGIVDDSADLEQGVAGRPIVILSSEKMTEQNFPGYKGFHHNASDDDDDDDDEGHKRAMAMNGNGGLHDMENVGARRATGRVIRDDSDASDRPYDFSNRFRDSDSEEEHAVVFDEDDSEQGESSGSGGTSHSFDGENQHTSLDAKPKKTLADITRDRDIRFGDLPSPRSYKYLEDTGPALVIKSPREQELEAQRAEEEAKRRGMPDIHFALSPIVGHGRRYLLGRSGSHERGGHRRSGSFGPSSHIRGESFELRRRSSADMDDEDDDLRDNVLRPTRSHVIGPTNAARIEEEENDIRSSSVSPANIPKITKRAITIDAPRGRQFHSARAPTSSGAGPATSRLGKRHSSISEFFFNRSATMDRVERIISRTLSRRKDNSPTRSTYSRRSIGQLPYLSYEPTVARNSKFIGLTDDQRAELGGIEYQALRTLAVVLVAYFFGFWILANICLIPWIQGRKYYRKIVEGYTQNSAWWGAFMATSTFMDVGFTIIPTSLIEFQDAVFPLLLMSFLIVIGNTGFPCMLRLIIWMLHKVFPPGSRTKESLQFLLEHPRRCFTLLFPSGPTWWLFAVLVILNGVDLILFVILDLDNSIFSGWSGGQKVLDGLFQAFSTRTAGLAVVDLSKLHPAVQVSYLVMMYISVMPIAISVRRTNVYEEQSLGIYGSPSDDESGAEDDGYDFEGNENSSETYAGGALDDIVENEVSNSQGHSSGMQRRSTRRRRKRQRSSFVANHLRRQLSFDLWYIFLGLFVICICEGGKIQDRDRYDFTVFSVLFEVVSAYGTVGLSLGYPGTNTSFCAQFTTISKLVIIAMMLRGRHRGLPYALDRAILLPSQKIVEKDKDAEERVTRRMSMGSMNGLPRTSTVGRSSTHDGTRRRAA
ncbi:cation transport protein-domain-containing protein [Myxozyma melibiosi]|uniref:Potassium transport protein n=1 Tax=Myxozyma melibiosi TaxID=54550 RepID=A0ABR1F138_9ASCO